MENEITELYSEKELARVKRGLALLRAGAVALALITLGLCVYFCISADRHYPKDALIRTIACSCIGGWAVITLRVFFISRLRYRRDHIKAMLEGRREEITGSFALTRERTFIIKGVAMRRVEVTGNEREHSLQVYDRKAPLFNADKATAVYAVHGFIVGYRC